MDKDKKNARPLWKRMWFCFLDDAHEDVYPFWKWSWCILWNTFTVSLGVISIGCFLITLFFSILISLNSGRL